MNLKTTRENIIKFKKIHKDVKLPGYMTTGSAGFDFYVIKDIIIYPYRHMHKVSVIPTGLKVQLPEDYEIQIWPKSGLSISYPGYIANSPGTIDSDYRGEIGIIVVNNTNDSMLFKKGNKIAQGVLKRVDRLPFVEITDDPDYTERNNGAYGSTGE